MAVRLQEVRGRSRGRRDVGSARVGNSRRRCGPSRRTEPKRSLEIKSACMARNLARHSLPGSDTPCSILSQNPFARIDAVLGMLPSPPRPDHARPLFARRLPARTITAAITLLPTWNR